MKPFTIWIDPVELHLEKSPYWEKMSIPYSLTIFIWDNKTANFFPLDSFESEEFCYSRSDFRRS
jgi:hypothetical protein